MEFALIGVRSPIACTVVFSWLATCVWLVALQWILQPASWICRIA